MPIPRSSLTRRPRLLLTVAGVAAALTLAGCASTAPESDPDPDASFLSEYGLDGLDTREIIDTLDATPVADRPADLMASVRPDALELSSGLGEATLPMPEDEVYVSIAPYRSQTHDCHFHSLTTCLGELANTAFDVTVTDAETGETILDESRTSFDNGFVGLWLPRGTDAEVRLETEGLSAEVDLAGDSDATCVTTAKLG